MCTAIERDDQHDINQLLSENRTRVFNFIKNKVHNHHVAEDLLQDTFLEAYRGFHRFRKDSKFSTWLIGIAINIVRNYYNRAPECRYNFVDDTTTEFEVHNTLSSSNMEQNLIHQDILGHAVEKLDTLPCDIRDIFKLTVHDNVPYKDIACRFNTSVSNIKIKIFRAREKLNSLFETPVLEEFC